MRLTPASIVKADRLADVVCHDEQMTIWEGELLGAVADSLRMDLSYDELLEVRHALRSELRSIIE